MKNLFAFTFILILFSCHLQAQLSTSIVNQKTYGGNENEFLCRGLKNADNSFIIGGNSGSGISGDKTDTNRGIWDDFWIMKLNSDLSIRWQKTIGGNNNDDLYNMVPCQDGGFLLIGTSASPISGDKTVAGFGDNDFWTVKIDSTGNILWQNVYGGSGSDAPSSVIRLKNGKYLIGGSSASDISGVKTENSRGLHDYWIVCIDSLGNKLWDKTIGGSQGDGLWQIIQVSDNGILLYGISNSPISGEKTAASFGLNDIWLVKIDTTGNVIWDKTFGGNDTETAGAICYKNGSIYMACLSFSGISGTKTDTCRGLFDYWVLKLDADGNKIWDKTIGGNKGEQPNSIFISSENQLLITGSSNSDISGDKTEASYGLSDFWVVALDTNGNINWQKTIGGSDDDGCNDMIEIGNNNYMLFGSSLSGISGLKTEASRGQQDYWVVEIATNVGIENNLLSEKNLIIYPNPVTNNLTIETPQKAIIEIINIQGQIVKIYPTNDTITSFDISALQSGIYFLKLTTAEGSLVKKFVKE